MFLQFVVGADAFLLPYRGGRERLRRARHASLSLAHKLKGAPKPSFIFLT